MVKAMSNQSTQNHSFVGIGSNIWAVRGVTALVLLSILLAGVAGVAAAEPQPTLLQTGNDEQGFMCNSSDDPTFLGDILDAILSFVTIASVPVFVLLYQLDGLLEFFALGADTKAKIKKHQRNMWVGAAKIFLAPAIISVVAESLGIGIPECVSVMPW